jgi:hypothetical protein
MVDFEVDENGYPTDESLEAIKTANVAWRGAQFMVNEFLHFAELVPYCSVKVTEVTDKFGRPAKEVFFATGG